MYSTQNSSVEVANTTQSQVQKMQVNETRRDCEAGERREKVEVTLVRLQSLKHQVSELRKQCEELRKLQSEKQNTALVCRECGNPINQGEEITLKNSFGNLSSYYHKDCFKAIWLSQNWIFDYSQPGFFKNV
jgi:hypothetical protein